MSQIERTDIRRLIEALKANIKSGNRKELSKRLIELIDVPTRRRIAVDLYKLDKYTREGDNVIVPGKVLGEGRIGHKINIAAIEYSEGAKEALKDAGATIKGIEEMIALKNVKIII